MLTSYRESPSPSAYPPLPHPEQILHTPGPAPSPTASLCTAPAPVTPGQVPPSVPSAIPTPHAPHGPPDPSGCAQFHSTQYPQSTKIHTTTFIKINTHFTQSAPRPRLHECQCEWRAVSRSHALHRFVDSVNDGGGARRRVCSCDEEMGQYFGGDRGRYVGGEGGVGEVIMMLGIGGFSVRCWIGVGSAVDRGMRDESRGAAVRVGMEMLTGGAVTSRSPSSGRGCRQYPGGGRHGIGWCGGSGGTVGIVGGRTGLFTVQLEAWRISCEAASNGSVGAKKPGPVMLGSSVRDSGSRNDEIVRLLID